MESRKGIGCWGDDGSEARVEGVCRREGFVGSEEVHRKDWTREGERVKVFGDLRVGEVVGVQGIEGALGLSQERGVGR